MFKINKIVFVIFVVLFSSNVFAAKYNKDVYTLKKQLKKIGVKLIVNKFYSDVEKVNSLSTIMVKNSDLILKLIQDSKPIKEIEFANSTRFNLGIFVKVLRINAKYEPLLKEKDLITVFRISSIIGKFLPLRTGNFSLDLDNLDDKAVLISLKNLGHVIERAIADKVHWIIITNSGISCRYGVDNLQLHLNYKDMTRFIDKGINAFPNNNALE